MTWSFVVETKEKGTKKLKLLYALCSLFSGLTFFSFKLYLKAIKRKRTHYKYAHLLLTILGMEENKS